MKRLLLMFLLVPTLAWASLFLASDMSTDNATSCVLDGISLPCTLDANKAVWVDLSPVFGTYTVRAKFCVQGGLICSEWSLPFTFTKPVVDAPKGLRLSK